MARPEKHTVEYFPFYVKDGKTLFVLESKYRATGTGFFTNVFRFLSETPHHHFCLKESGDRIYFFAKTKVNEDEGTDMLNMMAETGKIDKDLWITHQVIASQDFLNSIKDAYEKRRNGLITMDEIRSKYVSGGKNGIYDTENSQATAVNSPDNTQTKLNYTKLNYIKDRADAPLKKDGFKKPNLNDVKMYCLERHNNINPQSFIDYYTSNGWRVGKNPMKDWRAAVRTWEKNNFTGGNNGSGGNRKHGGRELPPSIEESLDAARAKWLANQATASKDKTNPR